MRINESLTELIGNTPLLRLHHYSRLHRLETPLIIKLEYMNPHGSIKDRAAYAMVKDAEEKGLIGQGTVLIEATSGNTGLGLAAVAAVKGYPLLIIMPDHVSEERKQILKALGAQVICTPGSGGMKGAIAKAEELVRETKGGVMLQQFKNPANTQIHRETTAEEIWRDTDGKVDIVVAGVGTGGTITGVGEVLKKRKPQVQILAVEPFDSPVLSKGTAPRPHQLSGIGLSAGFIPTTLNVNILDEIFLVKTEEAYGTARELAKREGLLVGVSSGAAVYAACQAALRPQNQGKMIVALAPDSGKMYLSTALYHDGHEG